MVLYHFTAAHFERSIRSQGLTRGALPWNALPDGRPEMRRGFQWLTSNASFSQPWCLLGNLPYSRNAIRIIVDIPMEQLPQLAKWSELCRLFSPASAEELNRNGGDVENWFVFKGRIPPQWFLAIEPNYGERLRASLEPTG
jgi:hypothetical protein